ncbi:MAG: hypothetical protein U0822_11965 [Anaerolineae bacterium]
MGVMVILLAFAARLWNLGGPSLWLDEAMMLARAHVDWSTAVVGKVSTDLAPPLYPVLLHAWSVLGVQDAVVRYSSVVLGVLAVAVMTRLDGLSVSASEQMQARGQRGEDWLAALIFAIAPTQIYHAQQVNVYALVALLSALIFIVTQRAVQGRRRAWLALAVLAVASAYTYYGLAFLFVGMLGWLAAAYLHEYLKLLRPRPYPKPPAIGVGLLVTAAAILPVLPMALERSAGTVAAWAGQFAVLNDWVGLKIFLVGLVAEGIVAPLFPYAQVPTWLALGLTAVFAIGAWRRPAWFTWGWLVPLGLAYLASGFGVYPFSQRHVLFVAPIVYALLAAGLLSLRPAWLRWLAIASLAVILVTGWTAPGFDVPWQANVAQEEQKPVLQALAQERRVDDAIYVTYGAAAAAAHYQELGLLQGDAYLHQGWYAGRAGYQADQALGVAGSRPRLWVLISHAPPGEEEQLAEGLAHRGAHLVQRIAAPGAAALLFDLRAP